MTSKTTIYVNLSIGYYNYDLFGNSLESKTGVLARTRNIILTPSESLNSLVIACAIFLGSLIFKQQYVVSQASLGLKHHLFP